MKLYQLTKGDRVRIVFENGETSSVFIFDHVDGAYSYCTDEQGFVQHPVAWSEVIRVGAPEFEQALQEGVCE